MNAPTTPAAVHATRRRTAVVSGPIFGGGGGIMSIVFGARRCQYPMPPTIPMTFGDQLLDMR
jgi:hypothetical protein